MKTNFWQNDFFGPNRTWYALLFFVFIYNSAFGQIGVGAEGNISYPGILTSEKNNIRFKTGVGYGFFVRHNIYNADTWQTHLRYRATVSHHMANLPFEENSDYTFSNFGLDVLVYFKIFPQSAFYSGLSINLLSVVVKNKFYKNFNAEKILPSILFGWSYTWAEGFDVFAEVNSRFGSVNAGPGSEPLPVTGIGINVGITMYISEE